MNKAALAIISPILALSVWVGSLEYQIATSQKIRIRIQGHDPRDLLAGHFINFGLVTNTHSPCNNSSDGEDFCLCYQPESNEIFYEPQWGGLCSAKPLHCKLFIKGRCKFSRFIIDSDRYSFPEYYASVLQTLPPDSNALVSVSSSGLVRVLQLFSGDQTLEEYAAQKLQEYNLAPTQNPS